MMPLARERTARSGLNSDAHSTEHVESGASTEKSGLKDSFAGRMEGADRDLRAKEPGRERPAEERETDPRRNREGERNVEGDSPHLRRMSETKGERATKSEKRLKSESDSRAPMAPSAEHSPRMQDPNAPLMRMPQAPPREDEGMADGDEQQSDVRIMGGDNGIGLEPREPARSGVVSVPGAAASGIANSFASQGLDAEAPADPVARESLVELESMKDEQGQVRKKAMEDFMAGMQKEFGVKPEKIVEAFSRMDEESLMAPPEESTQAFLAKLQIPADEAPRAAEMYNNMVRTTGEAALNEKLIGLESGVNMDVISPREDSLRKLNSAIDGLNDAFARRGDVRLEKAMADAHLDPATKAQMRAQLAAEQMDAQLLKMAGKQGDSRGLESKKSKEEAAGFEAGLISGALAAGGDADAAEAMAPTASGAMGDSSAMGLSAMGMPSAAGLGGGSGQAATGGGSSGGGSFGGSSGGAMRGMAEAKSAFAGSMKEAAGKRAIGESAVDAKVPTSGATDPQMANIADNATPMPKAAAAGPAGMIMDRPTPTAADEQANIREMLHQAQMVLKKGGGEIKMDLKPEGMGQVRLKVSVDNGQVNVQMLTQSDAAKHMLEKGLHELKTTLAAHQLKLDGLKVDVSNGEMQKHMDQNSADDQARQSTRQFANDVMGQFRDERQAFQQGFMENPGWRQYGRNPSRSKMDAEAPAAVASAQAAERARRSSTSRLDLVA